jgi:hypothetical protein
MIVGQEKTLMHSSMYTQSFKREKNNSFIIHFLIIIILDLRFLSGNRLTQ